ncbi:amino acid-binding protein [Clostridia bacterium]|nr:amino acid-binding protein [Clostridia bacterium]
MLIKQVSVFVENKTGRLSAILNILKNNKVNIRALSIADTHDFGILRLITDNPENAFNALKNEDCTVTLNDLIAVCIGDEPGCLAGIVDLLAKNNINIEYMYDFNSHSTEFACIVLRVTNNEKAIEIFNASNIRLLEIGDI